jgi:hypothetical protein
MGKPSDRKRSAQRPGKHERTRVKRHSRSEMWGFVPGGDSYHVKAGRKKWERLVKWQLTTHLSVKHNSESAGQPTNGQAIS